MTKQHFGRLYLQHRYRIEERFLPNSFDLRFRYFLSANIALSNKELIDKTIYLSLYNELFELLKKMRLIEIAFMERWAISLIRNLNLN
jgi:hypothetical protein